MSRARWLLLCVVVAATGCPKPEREYIPDSRPPPRLGPEECGDIETSDIGRQVHAFLQATIELEAGLWGLENDVKEACAQMAEPLGLPTEGDIGTVCHAVAIELDAGPADGGSPVPPRGDAISAGMTVVLRAGAETKPISESLERWNRTLVELAGDQRDGTSGLVRDKRNELGDKYLCAAGQLRMAASDANQFSASLDRILEVVAELSAAAGAP